MSQTDERPITDEVTELQKEIGDLRDEAAKLQKEIHRLKLERDVLEKAAEIIKKGQGVSLKNLTNREKAAVIDALRDRYSLKELLSVLRLPKSSYCYLRAARTLTDKYAALTKDIRKIFNESQMSYGYRRIVICLRRKGIVISEKVVRRIMKQEGLVVSCRKRRKYCSYKGEITPAADNVINRNFKASAPNCKWLTDITEFNIPAGKVYLSPIIDCFNGMPVAWSIGTSPSAELVNTMLDQAIAQLQNEDHPIVHSDRGCHYRWEGWIERMETAGLTRSMSKKGCSPDNAACEGFFGRLKNEMFYNRNWVGVSLDEFMELLDDYLHWYREKRIKVSLGGLSSLEYRNSLGLCS